MAFGYLHVSDKRCSFCIKNQRGQRLKLGAMEWSLVPDRHSLAFRLTQLLRISSNKYICTDRQARFEMGLLEVHSGVVDSIKQSIHIVGKTKNR